MNVLFLPNSRYLYSFGVIPVRRRKYFEKNEGLAKCISSAICAADLSVWRSSTYARHEHCLTGASPE